MIQTPGFDFSQTYIDHGYIELCIPPLDGKVSCMRFFSPLSMQRVNYTFFSPQTVSNGTKLLAYLATGKVYDDSLA